MQGNPSLGCALRYLVLALGGLVIMAAGLPTSAEARSPARPVILLSCPAADARDPLCQAMIQALAEATGGRGAVIRPVPRGQEAPRRPGDIGVALYLDDSAPAPGGHLEWQAADQSGAGPRQRGPDTRLDASGAALTPQSYASFTRELITATPGMAAALRGQR